jgi:hypothetical protein
MVLWFGTRTAGRVVDRSGFLVSTLFFHVFLVPVWPLGSIVVAEKGYLRDVGFETPLSRQSVLAGYVRTPLFALACVCFGMMFDGLFLESVVPEQRSETAMLGAALFSFFSLLWLAFMFIYGARRRPGALPTRFLGGVLGLAGLLALLFTVARAMPREPTLAEIAADRSLSNREALLRLARAASSEAAETHVADGADGLEVSVVFPCAKRSSSAPVVEGGTELRKAVAVLRVLSIAKALIEHGEARGLGRIRLSAVAPETGGASPRAEVYGVDIPRDAFRSVAAIPITGDRLLALDSELARTGVVRTPGSPPADGR